MELPASMPTGDVKHRELTWQAVVSAFVVSAVVSALYPYIVLKLGLGPNMSVVSAFLGAILLLFLAPGLRGKNRWMNNIVQTAGTSGASTAFMCVIAAAVDFANQNQVISDQLNGIQTIQPWPMFWWLTCAGGIGVLFTVLFRQHFLDDPKMVFADGVAAAETILVLDTPGREATDKLTLLSVCSAASALLSWVRDGLGAIKEFYFSPLYATYKAGIEWNLLTLGTGLLIGLNVSLSMLAATVVVVGVGPHLMGNGTGRQIALSGVPAQARLETERLVDREWASLSTKEQKYAETHGGKTLVAYMKHDYFRVALLWFMWPATGMMITSAMTAVLLKWRTLAETFTQLRERGRRQKREDVSLTTIVMGSMLLTAALAVVQDLNFQMSYVQTAVAVICSLPLILVGIRVLGETNNGPVSVMMNGLQAVFAVFWPASVGHNLIAAGMAGTCNSQGQGTIQDYKTGKIIGSTPRVLTWVQLAAVPVGAAAVAMMYPLLTHRYELGSAQLLAPTGIKIANMAAILAQGAAAFPKGALLCTVIASVAGVFLTVAKDLWKMEWLPSAAGFGFGLILPGTLNILMAVGGILGWLWEKLAKSSYDRYVITIASGFIAGDALVGGLITPVINWFSGQ